MIERTSLKVINKTLEENKNWKILDIGCGYTANPNANYIADMAQKLRRDWLTSKFGQ